MKIKLLQLLLLPLLFNYSQAMALSQHTKEEITALM